ncbi:amidohydrolase family protein [Ralstonia sp. 1B3]|uniref:amidohydrolase family protein n=1 Tax=Ralstonia sp. 1B3 TaxID=2997421 RepID=UPI002FC8922B
MRPHRLPQCLLSALTLSLALAGPARAAPEPEPVDILIRNGTVVDGSGGAPFVADVGIRDDRIVLVQPSATGVQAKTVLDARGLVVAPGFIDPHTHAYHNLISKDRHQNLPYLLQGVTTVVIGNDGIVLEGDGPDLDRIGPTLKALDANRIGTNVAMLVGHNAVRHRVMGDVARAPTADELKAMQTLMEDGMRDGAFGMSTGLVYAGRVRQNRRGGRAGQDRGRARRHLRHTPARRGQLSHGACQRRERGVGHRPAVGHPDPHFAHQGAGCGFVGQERGGHRPDAAGAGRRHERIGKPVSVHGVEHAHHSGAGARLGA